MANKKLRLSFELPEPELTAGIVDLIQLSESPTPKIRSLSEKGLLKIDFTKPLK